MKKSTKNSTPASPKPSKIDVEKAQSIVFQPNPGPQTDFLAASEQEVMYGGSAGGGKLVQKGDPVLTPNGFIKIEELSVGDTICCVNGGVQTITKLWGWETLPKWTVHFSDGTFMDVAEEHLWEYWISGQGPSKAKVASTKTMLEDSSKRRAQVRTPEAVHFDSKKVSIDPYLLGVLLGDGSMTTKSIVLTSHQDDQPEYLKAFNLPKDHLSIKGQVIRFLKGTRKSLVDNLTKYGLFPSKSFDKFIPDVYLINSVDCRLKVLQGLMDTDGYSAPDKNAVYYYTVSPKLKEGVEFLVRSLGGTVTTTSKIGKYRDSNGDVVDCQKVYSLYIRHPNPDSLFNLRRKKHGKFGRNLCQKSVISITQEGVIEGRCITVSDPSGLYIGKDFIVTHNSFAMVADPIRYVNNPQANMLLVRRSTEELRELISISKKLYPAAIEGARFLERDKTWVFPSGATLWMSYLDRDDDVSRYQGQAFCVAKGTGVLLGGGELKNIEDIQVGDEVQTLEGPKPVTWKSSRLQKKCVRVSVFSADGHLLSEQIQPDSHPIALLSSEPYSQFHDLSRSVSQFQKSPLQWLSYRHLESENLKNRGSSSFQEGGQNGYKGSERDNREYLPPLGLFYPAVRLSLEPQLSADHVPTQCHGLCKYQEQSGDLSRETSKKLLGSSPRDVLSQQSKGHTSLLYRLSYGGDLGALPEKQTTGDSLESYYSYNCQYGGQPPLKRATYSGGVPLQVGVEGLDPSYPHEDEKGCTHGYNRYLVDSYSHPYTQEPRELKVPLELCIVHVEPLLEPLSDVFDITVNSSNNYITESGLVNKNCWIGFDELTQWPTPYAWNYMRSRLRTAKGSGLSLYQRATTNPGGAGHQWVKKAFIDPAPPNTSFWATDPTTGEVIRFPKGHSREGEPLLKRKFIPATLFDNPYLAEDGMYEANLLSLPEHQRRQLLEGDWTLNEGAAFPEFNYKQHVIEPFDIPHSWTRFRAADYGYGSHTGVVWFAVSPSEQLIVYRELYCSKVTAVDLAGLILEAEAGDKIRYGVLDSSLWHNRGDNGPSLAEQMIIRGCRWRPADRSKGSRVSGKNEIHRRLQVDEFTGEPGLVFFNTCTNTISQLPSIPLDKNNPEDVDTNAEDHLYDALRYGVSTRPRSHLFDFDPASQKTGFQAADPVMGY